MKRDSVVAALRWAWMGTLGAGFAALLIHVFVLDPDKTTGVEGVLPAIGLVLIALGLLLLVAEDFARAGVRSDLPEHVGQVRLRASFGLRLRMAVTLLIALCVPLAVAAWLAFQSLILVESAALIIGFFTGVQMFVERKRRTDLRPDPRVREILERLCFRADLRVPDSAVAYDTQGSAAWTWRGTIVVTPALLGQLDAKQLEAVLAHELAHLAHRDAPVMDVAAAPSRLLLASWAMLSRPEVRNKRGAAGPWLAVFMMPYALPLAWISRIAMLSLSRARDLRADSAAAVLTGSPSALASALLALDEEAAKPGSNDLRAVRALSVVDTGRPRLGLLALHPATEDRVRRLQAMEETLQAGPV